MMPWKAAARQLFRRPGFSLAAVLLLAFGIAANVSVFSLVETVFLKPLPYPHAEQLAFVLESNQAQHQPESLVAPARLEDWSRLSRAFSALAGFYSDSETELSGTVPERLRALRVSARYFSVYGTA